MAEPPKLSERVVSFLSAGTRTGMLGYVADDGRPLVARSGSSSTMASWFSKGRATSKGRALARDSRVVICVDDPHPPYSFVQVQGIASPRRTAPPDDLLQIATRVGGRATWGSRRANEFGRRSAVPGEPVVRVQPTKVNSAFNIAD
jgi:PPOX class probable F420-dependent enzyme